MLRDAGLWLTLNILPPLPSFYTRAGAKAFTGGRINYNDDMDAAAAAAAESLQSCLTLCDPIDGSPPGSPVPGIFQARTLEWGATAFSR